MTRANEALLLLRVSFGISLAAHGANKLRGGIAGTQGWFASIGMRHARLQAWTASLTEIGAGMLLTVGLLTAPACMAIIALMVVAIATVHWKVGYFIFLPNGGWEYCAAIITVATALSLTGPGTRSIDSALDLPLSAGWWALPVGVAIGFAHLAISWRPSSPHSKP